MKRISVALTLTLLMSLSYGSLFDYGIATKGPLNLSGNILLDGYNITVDGDVYIESLNYNEALEVIGDVDITGDVKIVNPDGWVTMLGGGWSIGGETGVEAIQNHVEFGASQLAFPTPDAGYFSQYATGITIDSSTDLSTLTTLNNVRIAAGTNPNFTSDVQINGVLYIEQPNVVDFGGSADITGVIVGDGDYTDSSETNQLVFRGNVLSSSVAELPESYGDLRDETGTFAIAPGFAFSMGGSFDTLNGCIAANGVEFFGNAGGIIGGSVLNYSDEPMELSGNGILYISPTGGTEIPAGFIYEVPEPCTLLLLAAGTIAVRIRQRRQ